MQRPTRSTLALLALPSVTLAVLELPRFAPAREIALRKSFAWDVRLSFVELRSTMGGMPVPEEYLPELEVEIEGTSRLVVVDELEGVAAGRPTRLVRHYEEILGTSDETIRVDGADSGSRAVEGESALEGARVVFTWDEAAGEYRAAFQGGADEARDEALLGGLREDLDLRGFLPPADREPGAPWDVDPDVIRGLLEPGGELALTGLEEPDGAFEEVSFEAAVAATLAAPREEDGRELAVIELTGNGSFASERPSDLSFVPFVTGTATETRTTRFELEGRLAWDLGARRAHACELTLDVEVESTIAKDPGQEGPSFDSTTLLSGEWTFRAEVEPAD